MKVNIGKNTLGGGNKMQIDLRTYNRSTHNLSHAWRSTMGVGTLVPCFKQVALPGDTFDIQIDAKVLTHPTVGPLFGSYKLQIDFFTCPIRLYQAMLHNNALNIGLDMSKVLLPEYKVIVGKSMSPTSSNPWSQIHPSCVLAYLGQRGYRASTLADTTTISRNAVPLLAYVDIFKNYYANTQEENFYWLGMNSDVAFSVASTLSYDETTGNPTSGSILIQPAGKTTIEELRTAAKAGSYIWGRMVAGFDDEGQPEVQWRDVSEYTYEQMTEGYKFVYTGDNPANFTLTANPTTKAPTTAEGLPKRFMRFQTGKTLNVMSGELAQFDQLREDILAAGTSQFFIDNTTRGNYSYFDNLFDGQCTTQGTDSMTTLASSYAGAGLILKTHQSDVFNNWINSEWVDGENGISAVTAIDTSGGEFTIDTLNLAKKVYDMLNRIAISGGTYRDWINTVYTSNYTLHAETPIYEGGMSDEIVFEEVVSNSATDEQPLGTLAGRGRLGGQRKGGKLHIKISEPSYIIGIVSITPRVDYCQGNDWDIEALETMNDLHKPQLDGIGYQDLTENLMAWWRDDNTAVGKQPAWIHYMTAFNKTFGNFAIEGNEAFMVMNRYYEPVDGLYTEAATEGELNYTTYINPLDFNYTFADTSLDAQNFWVQIGFGVEARRVMSAKQIPNL